MRAGSIGEHDAGVPGVPPLSDHDFERFQELILREAGILLAPFKKSLLVSRLGRRLRTLGLSSFREYLGLVADGGDPSERIQMLDCISTNETQFFREPRHFAFLEERAVPAWVRDTEVGRRPRSVRVWSAACATGEEPFSVAMVLLDRLPPDWGWRIDVLASDLSTRALAVAREATWPLRQAAEIPKRHLKRFMLRGTRSQQGRMRAAPELRAVVRFERINLAEERWPVEGAFDLILCRNVLIYFGADARAQVVARLVERLAPSGWLLVGHAETLAGVSDRVKAVEPTIYARPRDERP